MLIKKFTAAKLHEALAQVRQHLGPDAIILDRNQTTDERGEKLWLVHAAIDTHPKSVRETQDPATREKYGPKTDRLDQAMQRLERIILGLGIKETESLRSALGSHQLQESFDHLVRLGVAPPHAFDLAEEFLTEKVLGRKHIPWSRRMDLPSRKETVILAGPPGSGKTTLAAKLAAHYSLKGVRVAMLTTDTERIGGTETLALYASTLGIPFIPLRKPMELRELSDATNSAQLLLVDTEGWSPGRHSSLKRQRPLWEHVQSTRRMMIMPANMDEEDGMRLLVDAKQMAATNLAFTHLDGTHRPGKIVNWTIASGLPPSFCSFGPDVPEQMGWISARTLAALMHRLHRKTGRFRA